jgi:hypothetical protein
MWPRRAPARREYDQMLAAIEVRLRCPNIAIIQN